MLLIKSDITIWQELGYKQNSNNISINNLLLAHYNLEDKNIYEDHKIIDEGKNVGEDRKIDDDYENYDNYI